MILTILTAEQVAEWQREMKAEIRYNLNTNVESREEGISIVLKPSEMALDIIVERMANSLVRLMPGAEWKDEVVGNDIIREVEEY